MSRTLWILVGALGVLPAFGLRAAEPTVIPLGAGSYAAYPPAHEGATAATMVSGTYYTETTNRPLPSNDWWTDLLIARYAGTMWALPFGVAANNRGLSLYYGTNWNNNGRTMLQEFPLNVEGVVPVYYDTNDLLLADFEATNYPAGWTTTGSAFGPGPAAGTAAGQSTVSGFVGARLVNSYRPGDGATGTLRSAPFPISHANLHFLIAGGNWPTQAAVRLTVSGAVVRTTTGENSENLKWHTWEVSDLIGQTGRLDLVDTATGGWGHLCADQFFLSNDPTNQAGKWSTAFFPQDARATDWSDWLVAFALTQDPTRRMEVTLGHGLPFVWLSATGVEVRVRTGTGVRYFNEAGTLSGFPVTTDHVGVAYAGRAYGLFAPDGTQFGSATNVLSVTFTGNQRWLVIGVMPSTNDLAFFQRHAYVQPTNTVLDWSYDVEGGRVLTGWTLQTKILKGTNTLALQGWLPHHYRTTSNDLAWTGHTYVTPRGPLKLAVGTNFHLVYAFGGLLPNLPAPHATGTYTNDFDIERMESYLATGATKTDYGADTYWGGKDLINFGRFLTFAHELDQASAATLQQTLRTALVDWLTYTPGETEHYFAAYPNWRALVGFNDSYGSVQFNDHHFHYGYLTAAAALLGLYDPDFLADYGPMLTAVAREYANGDRNDTNFPFLRTFDPWGGHSYAGGLSDGNGNNQESSSEAMQAWGGLFTLGHVLGDSDLRATGALGYAMEAEAIAEYWNNYYGYRDGPASGTFPPVYTNSIVGILFDDGNAYATYFSGDPGWIYGIQWLPPSPFLNYAVRDPVFARHQYTNMMALRDVAAGGAASNTISNMGAALGNVLLGYLQMFDPEQAIALDTALWGAGDPVANDTFNSGINYYFMHANRRLGVPRFDHHIGTPFSQVYAAGTTLTYVAYNTSSNLQLASVYSNTTRLGFIALPPRQLTSTHTLLATGATFAVTATFPADGETTAVTQLAVVFSQLVNTGTLAGASISGPGISGLTLSTASAGPLALFDFVGTPATGAAYQVTIPANASAQAGQQLGAPYLFTFTVAAPPPPQPVEFLKGYFPLNETNGTTLLDQSAYAQNGTYTNGPLLAQAGATNGTGTAVSFDGVDDFAVLDKTYKLGLNGNFTVAAWLRPTSVTGDRPVLGTDRRETHKGLQLMIRNGHPVLGFYGDETTGAATLATGRWSHVAWRFYRGIQSVFVNGALDTTSAGHGYFSGIDPVLLGRWGGTGGTPAYFAGRLDEVQIYGRALTDAEISALYAQPGSLNTNGQQNFAPLVDAGPEQSALHPAPALLTGTVIDDDLPDPPHAVTTWWTQVSGPGPVAFANATNLQTTVSAGLPGKYTVRLTAGDGAFTVADEVTLWLSVTNPFGLVLHYPLDETNGVSAYDRSGSQINGSLEGSPALGQPGQAGTAISFNGSGQFIRIGNPGLLNQLTNRFTVALWVRPTSYGGNRVLFGSNWQNQNGWSLRFSGTNLALERLGPAQVYNAGFSLPLATWTHVAAVYGASNDVTFFVNGVAMTNIPGSSAASPATQPWYVAGNGGDYFNGRLDDVQVYQKALAAADLAYLFANPGETLTDDTDHDGMADTWESAHQLTVGINDANGNPDLDAWSNEQEYLADSDPQASNEPLEILIRQSGDALNVSAVPVTTNSRRYLFFANTNLLQGDWLPVGPAQPGAGDGAALIFGVTNVVDPAAVFRISVQVP